MADPNVFNHLVDRQAVESVVVCTTQALAKEVVAEGGVRGATCAVTRDWYRWELARHPRTLQKSEGGNSAMSVRRHLRCRYFVISSPK